MSRVSASIILSFQSAWLSSTGGTGSGDLDELCRRDADGLPIVPMSSIKGVLRESAERLEAAGRPTWPAGTTASLFGDRPASRQGLLVFAGEARLGAEERQWFRSKTPTHREALFDRRAATAIDAATGTAAARTLRTSEIAAPMKLVGCVRLRTGAAEPAGWRDRLAEAAAWTLAIGKGKFDGLGRVTIEIGPREEQDAPADAAGGEGADRLVLLLEQTEPATFSVRSATEGAHATRLQAPGSTLLGWAARDYARFRDPSGVFHGAKVRFGDARPLAEDGSILWPFPKVIVEPKHGGGGVRGGRLTPDALVARPRRGPDDEDPRQYEAVDEALATSDGRTVPPSRRLSLRTAMEDGRPATGQLFGYVSLQASPDRPLRYVAEIERRGLNAEDWERLDACFPEGGELILGRAAGAGQGGAFRVRRLDPSAMWPKPPASAPEAGRVVVWALSDLALVDRHGEPDLTPLPQTLGLGEGELLASESAIASRRYAPWNAHLGCRDVEQAVIEAGSVLVFQITESAATWPAVVGRHQEQGLGRLWINPPLLSGLRAAGDQARPVATSGLDVLRVVLGDAHDAEGEPVQPSLGDWAQSRLERAHTGDETLALFRAWRRTLASFYRAPPAGEGPSARQWRNAAAAAVQANSMAALRTRLFDGQQAICRTAAANAGDWGKQGLPDPRTIGGWLCEALAPDMSLPMARALLKLAAESADALAAEARAGAR